jgi:hypothetical protein
VKVGSGASATSGGPKKQLWHTRPGTTSHCRKGGETSAEWRQKGHRLGVGPALADPYVELLAEHRVAKAEEDSGEQHAPAKKRPA